MQLGLSVAFRPAYLYFCFHARPFGAPPLDKLYAPEQK
jgi:hypothetical protein